MKKKTLINTEQDVLTKIGAQDFRSISKDQIMRFVSAIPEMDRDVAIKCLEQFPEFKDYSKEIVKNLFVLFDNAIHDNRKARIDAVEAYRVILDKLNELASQPDISIQEQKDFVEMSIDVADKIAELHNRNNEFLQKILHAGSLITTVAIAAGSAILGVKLLDKDK